MSETRSIAELAPQTVAELVDAVARGRVSLAEVAGLGAHELEAMFEVGAQRLDLGRDEDGARIFGALVVLMPFVARFWRAYGVALHRCGAFVEAAAAYEVAVALEPAHVATRGYRAEVLAALGHIEQARGELMLCTQDPSDPRAAARAAKVIDKLPAIRSAPRPLEMIASTSKPTFSMGNGRTLPLADSRFPAPPHEGEEPPTREEVTVTRRLFAVLQPMGDDGSGTSGVFSGLTEPRLRATKTRTTTGVIGRRREGTGVAPTLMGARDTAIVDRRRRTRRPAAHDPELTALVRRRLGLPITGDEP